jgi:mannose-6-phosphate isomerase-like protein (cupin superfamily)
MSSESKYSINLDPKFQHLQLIDIPDLVEACKEKWFNQTLCRVNDSVVRLGIIQGEFHWHKHDEEDEFFLVLDGILIIDLEGQTIELSRHQGYTIPKGVTHRTRAPGRAVILMVESSGVQPQGD